MSSNEKHDNDQLKEMDFPSESSSCDLTEGINKLHWSLCNEIICNFNAYSQLMCGKKLATAAEESLLKANSDIYRRLINLPLKSACEATDENARPIKVALDLGFSMKGQILNALIANRSLTWNSATMNEEAKLNIIKKNNWLVARLMKLPVSVTGGLAEEEASQSDNNRMAKLSESTEQVASLNKKIVEKQFVIDRQRKKFTDLIVELNELKDKQDSLGDLVKRVNGKIDIGLNRESANFECTLGDMSTFLRSKETRKSVFFFCSGMAWSVLISKNYGSNQTFLSVFVSGTNFAESNAIWSTNVCYKLTLLNQRSCFKNVAITSNREFSDHSPSWGRIEFIPINELCSGGYIVNDEIKIRVHLQVGGSALSNFLNDFKEVAWPAANLTLLSAFAMYGFKQFFFPRK